jgi:ABC-type Fe3+ transport system substrate-binding protein
MPWIRAGFGWFAALLGSLLHAESVVIVLTPHPEEIRQEFETGFRKWHEARHGGPVRIEWRDVGGSGEAQRFVESEFASKPSGIGIDVFFGGGPEPFLALGDRKLVEVHQPAPEVLEGLGRHANGAEVFDPGFGWFGACLSSFGILENTRVQRLVGLPLVERWDQLADPRLVGWVGAGDPRLSGTMNNMYEAFLQAYGWEKGWDLLTRIAGNVRQFDRLSSSTAKEALLGQVAYAFCIDYYGFIQIEAAGATNMTFVLPKDFVSISPDGIAILKGAPNRVVAGRLLDFVLGDAGQALWMLPAGHPEGPRRHSLVRLPVRPEMYQKYAGQSPIPVNPFTVESDFRYDARIARARRDIVRNLFGSLIVDCHADLVPAWRRVIAAGTPEAAVRQLGSVPMTEAEALALAKGEWSQAEARNRLKAGWQAWAQEKYRKIARDPNAAVQER